MSEQTITIGITQTPPETISDIRQFIAVKGDQGEQGIQGPIGTGAWEYAVLNQGFTGTKAEYYNQFRQVFIQADEPIGAMDGSIWIQPY